MKDVRPIIGIAAEKQVGKDTVAKMLCYIFNTGVLRCNFREWTIKYDTNSKLELPSVTHFGDYPKDILSKMFGIERWMFDDIEYKEHKAYLIGEKRFIDVNAKLPKGYIVASLPVLVTTPLGSLCQAYDGRVAITIRNLMQYFGTNIGRNCINEYCWINPTISDAIDIRNKYGYCVIADVRFENESNAIRAQKDGYVIRLVRNNSVKVPEHESELLKNVKYDVLIENNGSKLELFYKVVELAGAIINRVISSSSSTGEKS